MPPLRKSFSREVRGDEVKGGTSGGSKGVVFRLPPNPNDVKINVQGAFIIDDETTIAEAKNDAVGEGVHFENKDIRLPHHTGVVSHVAVDVSADSSLDNLALGSMLIKWPDRRLAGQIGLFLART